MTKVKNFLTSILAVLCIEDCAQVAGFNLPEDLIIEILLRLPVKSILKFRCVSKLWRCLISKKRFVQSHLDLTTTKDPKFIHQNVVFTVYGPNKETYISQKYSLNSLLYEESTDAIEVHLPMENNKNAVFVGYCNGLCCIMYVKTRRDLLLWNPATRKYKFLPRPTCNDFGSAWLNQCGFGVVDGVEYKVFIMLTSSSDNAKRIVRVYSSRTNSWKTIDDFIQVVGLVYGSGIFLNENLHWIDSFQGSIVYYDLKREVHGTIRLPTEVHGTIKLPTELWPSSLCAVGGYLCVHDRRTTNMDAWILKSYGSKDQSWSKLVSIRYNDDPAWSRISNPKLVSVTHEGEILMVSRSKETHDVVWMVYDPKTKSCKESFISNSGRIPLVKDDQLLQPRVYIQSLMSPDEAICYGSKLSSPVN